MKPSNRVERNNAFYSFLLLFLVTIAVVITVAFYSVKVELTDNKRLRTTMLSMQNEKNLSDSFRVSMNIVLNELDKYETKKEPTTVTKRSVQLKIDKMARLLKFMPYDSSDDQKSLYDLIIENLAKLNDTKMKLQDMEDRIK
ncbi:MAG: type VI secretion system TssO [Chitinophagaceae bacterium]